VAKDLSIVAAGAYFAAGAYWVKLKMDGLKH